MRPPERRERDLAPSTIEVCSYDPCPLVQGEILMWRDGSHLTRTIVEQLTPSIREMLAQTIAGPASQQGRRE